MASHSPQAINEMATQMFFNLGQLAGVISNPELQIRLANAMAEDPEGNLTFAACTRLHEQLGNALKAAKLKRA
jgi:hypothetical protein